MIPIAAGQSWIYRAPKRFEQSRLVIGAVVLLPDDKRLICCGVTGAPWRLGAGSYELLDIALLPLTESAFWSTVVRLEGVGGMPPNFAAAYRAWFDDPRGLAAFSVPFEGFLETMIDLQRVRKKFAAVDAGPVLDEIRFILAEGLMTSVVFPKSEKQFEEIIATLRRLDPTDLRSKLIVAGMRNRPIDPGQKRCLECTYYLPNSKWCDLPELSVPCEPFWSCRLWRI